MAQKIPENDRIAIAAYFQEGVDANETKAQLDARRREIERLFCPQYTEPQVNAVCSQVIIQTKRRLAKMHITAPSDASTPVVSAPPVQTSMEEAHITSPLVAPAITLSPILTPVDGPGRQYENETKERWFNTWLSMIMENTSPAWRWDANLITLAGPRCLRLPAYIAAGFDPRKIVAVEGGTDADKAEFERNLPEGVQKRLERLEKFIQADPTRYGVVDFDFTGPISDDYLEIVQQTLLADRAYVLVNVLGRREQAKTSASARIQFDEVMTARRKTAMEQHMLKTHPSAEDDTTYDYEAIERQWRQADMESQQLELAEVRANIVPSLFLQNIQKRRVTENKHSAFIRMMEKHCSEGLEPDMTTFELARATLEVYCTELAATIQRSLLHSISSSRDATHAIPNMANMMVRMLYQIPVVRSLKKVRYQSESKGSPYLSIMAEMQQPTEGEATCPAVIDFVKKHVEDHIQKKDPYRVAIAQNPLLAAFRAPLVKGGKNKNRGAESLADTLQIRGPGGLRVVASIKLRKLFDETSDYVRWLDKYPLTFCKQQMNVPWEVL